MKYYDANKVEQTAVNFDRYLGMNNPKILFNKDSDLVVGGVPMETRLPPQVSTTNYTGCVDGLEVNDHFVGTWNSEVSLLNSITGKIPHKIHIVYRLFT